MQPSSRCRSRHPAEVDDKVTGRAEKVVLVDPVLGSSAAGDIRVRV